MAGRRVGAGLALAALALSAAGCGLGGSTKTVTSTVTQTVATTVTESSASPPGPCFGGQLVGSFNLVPGSAAAGQVSYALTLTNISQTACTVAGLPRASLEDKSNAPLATNVTGSASATVVTIEPSDSATAAARFSPDVPNSQAGKCEPAAYQLSVNPGQGTVEMPVKPATSVCDGTLNFDPYAKR